MPGHFLGQPAVQIGLGQVGKAGVGLLEVEGGAEVPQEEFLLLLQGGQHPEEEIALGANLQTGLVQVPLGKAEIHSQLLDEDVGGKAVGGVLRRELAYKNAVLRIVEDDLLLIGAGNGGDEPLGDAPGEKFTMIGHTVSTPFQA